MRVLVVGSGAREHALARALACSAEVVVCPGNAGMTAEEGVEISVTDAPPDEVEADLVVVGPEAPLVDGLADRLRAKGRTVLGPGADGARLEGSKAFMKQVVASAGVPSARYVVFDAVDAALSHLRRCEGPYVVKTDGLAAGKGVLVTERLDEAEADVVAKLTGSSFGEAGRRVVIEEAMAGEEVSLLALADGRRVVPFPLARDYKRVDDGDSGPNTGGMGAHSPVPGAEGVVSEAMDRIVEPTLAELRRRGIDYRGVLYAGLMLTDTGPRLVEFNVRFGDPEAEVVLPRVGGDLAELLYTAASGDGPSAIAVEERAAVCVVMAAAGYPSSTRRGDRIEGLDRAAALDGVRVHHGATSRGDDGAFVTDGGRVLAVTAVGEDLTAARRRAYEAVGTITFAGAQVRSDIALAAPDPVVGGRR